MTVYCYLSGKIIIYANYLSASHIIITQYFIWPIPGKEGYMGTLEKSQKYVPNSKDFEFAISNSRLRPEE